jgi:hypothetical protein
VLERDRHLARDGREHGDVLAPVKPVAPRPDDDDADRLLAVKDRHGDNGCAYGGGVTASYRRTLRGCRRRQVDRLVILPRVTISGAKDKAIGPPQVNPGAAGLEDLRHHLREVL